MKISVAKLNVLFEKVISHLNQLNVQDIELRSDYYWKIDEEDVFEFSKTPIVTLVGQVSDDLKELDRYCDENVELDILVVERLVGVLNAINYDNPEFFI